MQDFYFKTDGPKAPIREQQFYELSLLDETNDLGTRYCFRQAHAEWSEIDHQIMWGTDEVEYFGILDEANRRYEERRQALAQKRLIHSDMDLS